VNALPFLLMAVVLAGIARWGGRQAPKLAGYLDEEQRERKRRVVRRGARACWVMAVLFTAFACVNVVAAAIS